MKLEDLEIGSEVFMVDINANRVCQFTINRTIVDTWDHPTSGMTVTRQIFANSLLITPQNWGQIAFPDRESAEQALPKLVADRTAIERHNEQIREKISELEDQIR